MMYLKTGCSTLYSKKKKTHITWQDNQSHSKAYDGLSTSYQRDLHTTRRDLAGCGQGVDEIESYQNNRSKSPVSFSIVKEDYIYYSKPF